MEIENLILNFTSSELEELRKEILSWVTSQQKTSPSHLYSVQNFSGFIIRETWISEYLTMPFTDVPLKIGQCHPDIQINWHNIILGWRLRIGK